MRKNDIYDSFDYDTLTPGSKLKVEHEVYPHPSDMTDMVSKSIEELQVMLDDALTAEGTAYNAVVEAALLWEPKAIEVRKIERAMEYLRIPEAKHTANKWAEEEYHRKSISNAVYKMSVYMNEYSSYRSEGKRWDLKWYIYTNSPHDNYNIKVAGQDKSFPNKDEAEKYMQGRIKAYSHLFTEISPPIPEEYLRPFIVHGHLLPGYTKASDVIKEQEKPSVKDKLKDLKSQIKSEPKNAPSHKRSEVQIE